MLVELMSIASLLASIEIIAISSSVMTYYNLNKIPLDGKYCVIIINFILACLGILFSILALLYPIKFTGHILYLIWVYLIFICMFISVVVSNNIIPSRILGMTFSYILAVIFTGLGIWGNLMSEISSV